MGAAQSSKSEDPTPAPQLSGQSSEISSAELQGTSPPACTAADSADNSLLPPPPLALQPPAAVTSLVSAQPSGVVVASEDAPTKYQRRSDACSPPPAKRQALLTTDLSDRHIQLCAQDAILAVQKRVVQLQMLDHETELHNIAPYGSAAGASSTDHAASSSDGAADAAAAAAAARSCVLDSFTQRAFYEMLHGPLTALQHQTALRRHDHCSRCLISDVLHVSDVGQRLFRMIRMGDRGPFARVCREWAEIARLCWQAEEFELVRVHQHVHLRNLAGPVTQLAAWMRASQTKPIFFLLALSEGGRLEQLRISCKKAEPGLRRPDADDEVRVEHTKDWRLEESVPSDPLPGVTSQFVVTKHHAYCVVAVHGQALLVKLGGNTNGTHEHMYTDRFPAKVTTMSMCPLDNNIIAFGVPVAPDQPTDGAVALGSASGSGGGLALIDAGDAFGGGGFGGGGGASSRVHQLIELVNFAQSAKIQTLATRHEQPMFFLDYSPDSEQLLSCSPDCIEIWYREARDGLESSRGPGALEERPERTLRQPQGTVLRLARIHPAWTSVLLATNEALEVRELRRAPSAADTPQLAPREVQEPPLGLKWRREGMQVTAATFIAQGNMLVVSDRGDRLLVLNYHGLQAAKRCVLPWGQPSTGLGSADESPPAAGHAGDQPPSDPDLAGGGANDLAAAPPSSGHSGGHGSGAGSSAERGSGSVGGGGTGRGRQGVCTVTSVVECPDVVGRCSEEWRSGISQLAVSSSRGDVLLVKL
jgi:uncharacterized membrane protein YgcG